MDYFKVNYDKLKNLEQKNYYIIIVFSLFILLYVSFLALFIKVKKNITYYGIINDGVLNLKINSELSDKIKKGNTLKFKDTMMSYTVLSFNEYDIIDNIIYESISLKLDGNFYNNEVGKVTIYYDDEKLCKYIFDLFK